MLHGFESIEIRTDETHISLSRGGSGPPILLLHGFPQTQLMWRNVAPLLASQFTVICPDLRGYGLSGCPMSTPDHAPYSKRAMARDMVTVMAQLGFPEFSVAGHDRGGRVAYRLALDHPRQIVRLAVLDILPTGETWRRADARLAMAYWPWSLLSQPEPLPEKLIAAAPDAIVDDAIGGNWGSPPHAFDPGAREAYVQSLSDPIHVHAICEEYRAAASIDRDHDEADRTSSRRIGCPTLVLWSATGPLAQWYADAGGPLAVWRLWADAVQGHPLNAGHFFPEEAPDETAHALATFFSTTG